MPITDEWKKIKKDKYTIYLMLAGLLVNVTFVWLMKIFQIPLYLDAIGTVTVAALAGALPGVAVGFFTNCITAFVHVSPNPMMMYYSILNVLLALITAFFTQKHFMKRWHGRLCAVLLWSFVGGVLGSGMSWLLYGFNFGQGVTAPFAKLLYVRGGLSQYQAQLLTDVIFDFVDKCITMAVFMGVIHVIPDMWLERLPFGYLYMEEKRQNTTRDTQYEDSANPSYRKKSIQVKITFIVITSSIVLCVTGITIASVSYGKDLIAHYSTIGDYVVQMMMSKITGDDVEDIMENGTQAKNYVAIRQNLYDILPNVEDIKYMYVYHIQQDGCQVIYDLDTHNRVGETLGTVEEFNKSCPYIPELLRGEEIPSFITNGTYGWLLSIYRPIRNSEGHVVAYAAVDIDMEMIKNQICSFIITIATMLMGVVILLALVILWFFGRDLLETIKILSLQAREFDFDGKRRGRRVRDRYTVNTGDELEEVFYALCRTEDEMALHIEEVKKKNHEISQMQRNIIYTLANMVENRDGNTGGHIKRTAAYVRLIGKRLRKTGAYGETVDRIYIKKLYDSAPLHDIGKIKIPDTILNKPGKFTPEEYEIMKKHTIEGRDIIKTSLAQIEDESWLSMAVDMALYHHEKWDGTGYPEGLSGEQIPLSARIMAVADVFDALVSKRSYKDEFSFEDAMEIIREDAGKHFDPRIVEAFVMSPEKVRDIMETF